MKKLVKKLAIARNIPMLALALFACVFIGNEVFGSFNALTEEEWFYDDSNPNADPTNPDFYTKVSPGTLEADCEQVEAICGIVAPIDQTGPVERPVISPELETLIQAGNAVEGQIYLRPHNP